MYAQGNWAGPPRNFNVFSNLISYVSSSSRVVAMQCYRIIKLVKQLRVWIKTIQIRKRCVATNCNLKMVQQKLKEQQLETLATALILEMKNDLLCNLFINNIIQFDKFFIRTTFWCMCTLLNRQLAYSLIPKKASGFSPN